MSTTVDITDSIALATLRAFLLSILPAGVEVVRAQVNRVPEPAGADFVLMTPMGRVRLATNVDTYADGYPAAPGVIKAQASTQYTVQLDVHGPNGAENAQIITTLFRGGFAADQFKASGYAIAPLYTGDTRQLPYLDEEGQMEQRWTLDAVMQISPVVTRSQDFAATVAIGIKEVDATFPP